MHFGHIAVGVNLLLLFEYETVHYQSSIHDLAHAVYVLLTQYVL